MTTRNSLRAIHEMSTMQRKRSTEMTDQQSQRAGDEAPADAPVRPDRPSRVDRQAVPPTAAALRRKSRARLAATAAAAAAALALIVAACGGTTGGSGTDVVADQATSPQSGEQASGSGEAGETAAHSEAAGEGGGASGEPGESGTQYRLDQTFDEVQSGARLILSYDLEANAFNGTVENTTNATLDQVRVEVHLSNGTEIGPTTPMDLTPGQIITITLPATDASFTTFSAHPEIGTDTEPGVGTDTAPGTQTMESGGGGVESGEAGHNESGAEPAEGGSASEVQGEESGTQYALNETHDEVRADARLILNYDPRTSTFSGTVTNTTAGALRQVRVEVHLSNGVELGPTARVDLGPGQIADVTLPAANQSSDTWSAHPEVGSAEGEHGGESESGEHGEGSDSGEHGGWGAAVGRKAVRSRSSRRSATLSLCQEAGSSLPRTTRSRQGSSSCTSSAKGTPFSW